MIRTDLFTPDDTPLGLIPPVEAERMKDRTWRSLLRVPIEWIERNWDDALNAHTFYKADPL